jgi:RimJ/RimL family protein N-acetyltransferase
MLEPITLTDDVVRLVPLSLDHVDALSDAAGEDPSLYQWTFVPRDRASTQTYVEAALQDQAAQHTLPFAIVRAADMRVVGSTRYLNIERWTWLVGHALAGRSTPDVCEIGATWLSRGALRSAVNSHAKRLLLTHAFEVWQVHAARLRTDARNTRSRAAIERIGAKLDGVVRAERPAADGAIRDTACYSITAEEWPSVRSHLAALAAR